MRYSKEHKALVHERIVDKAAAEFRARGFDGIGVADLMGEVGLTHGGFYAHFASKDALIVEALDRAFEQASSRLAKTAQAAPPAERLKAILDGYLTARHRDHPERGCAVAALGPEVARLHPEARQAFADRLHALAGLVEAAVGGDPATARARSLAILSGMVGALILSRALPAKPESDAVLAAARESLLALGG